MLEAGVIGEPHLDAAILGIVRGPDGMRVFAYGAEELVAELGAAFLAADLELTPEPRADHAAYIDTWLKILKADNRAIFTASSHAQRAVDYLHGLQPVVAPVAVPDFRSRFPSRTPTT